ncbi:hypothetical protein ACQKNX_23160 [Lysinibacillus sp. NPDC093712]|uniref:hypothetical protein n=1 Tax=Lysinibacillus sp. NPDC093712 TaxID=3390579 RepID=UPI003D00ECF1
MKITEITLPTLDEMNVMSLEDLCNWSLTLKPFYTTRFEISKIYEFDEYKKAIRYLWFDKMIENIKTGLNRWEGVADYPNHQ